MQQLSSIQNRVIAAPLDSRLFAYGPAGCGKTTAGTQRLVSLIKAGVPGEQILVLVPQRTLGAPYVEALYASNEYSGGSVSILTLGGLAQRTVDLFWPIVATKAGFAQPDLPPTFLTLETAQYYIAKIIQPLLDEGFFDSVVMDRNRLYSQVIDNLNKAAVVGFPHTEIGSRLASAWMGKTEQVHVYENAQDCANLFRDYCLEHNLLDFSLQLETFLQYLWPEPLCRDYLTRTYRHLIVDNIEEDTPAAHDLIQAWLPSFQSALVIYDEDAGYRRFLGADPENALLTAHLLPNHIRFSDSHVMSPQLKGMQAVLRKKLAPTILMDVTHPVNETTASYGDGAIAADWPASLSFGAYSFFPEMLDWVTEKVADLVERGVPPSEITILAPFISDSLRFSIAHRLEKLGIETRTHRPSRSLVDEPLTHCIFTLSLYAHPHWVIEDSGSLTPTKFDLAFAMVQAIEGLDFVRAQLLSDIVYRKKDGRPFLGSFDRINKEMQERITYRFGTRFEGLRHWIEAYKAGSPLELDHFISRLFGEVLSQSGYGLHNQFAAGEICANLIESIQKFRRVASPGGRFDGDSLGLEYIRMVREGIIAAQYLRSWQIQPDEAVWIAPAYTFLMSDRPVRYQFWLDLGSRSWSERLYQPLTHPYVLSRQWQEGRKWTDADEVATSKEALYRLVTGLLRRCRDGLYLGISKFSEDGYEQRGPLLRSLQSVLRESQTGTSMP